MKGHCGAHGSRLKPSLQRWGTSGWQASAALRRLKICWIPVVAVIIAIRGWHQTGQWITGQWMAPNRTLFCWDASLFRGRGQTIDDCCSDNYSVNCPLVHHRSAMSGP
ncbi:hypothetical protein SAMN06265222_1085 [Neorhodopirellula lusitana]|uniref:Uncharacterized protein n=1 Tax=Neorhodopirellula lusitana TaxID=445327 RepID=A0ABY1Q9E7_9BACT|nr:hypothetical protein SAMN06265222_1085 [Neorhodopirellula lusitana]